MPFRYIHILSFLPVLLITGNAFPQIPEIDSLERAIRLTSPDTTRVRLLNDLVNALREKNTTKALHYAQEAKKLADSLNDKTGLAHALENLGWLLYRRGDFSKSYDISAQALRLSEEIGDPAATSRCLINIAAIYFEQGLYYQAIEKFKDAYRQSKQIDDHRTMARSLYNIAYTYLSMNNLDSAYVYSQYGLKAAEEADYTYIMAFGERTLGDIYLARGDIENAINCFNRSLSSWQLLESQFLKASSLYRLGKAYLLKKNYDVALSYLLQDIEIAERFNFKDELERSYKLVSEIYHHKNDIPRAYEYQTKYLLIRDSLQNRRTDEQAALMRIRFETELKQAQIELLTKEARLKEEKINSQKVWMYFYSGCISFLLVLAFVLYYSNRSNRRAKLELQEKNEKIEKQAQQLKNLNATKDKLFSIISHDLRSPVASLRGLLQIAGASRLSQQEFIEVTQTLKRNLDSVYDDLDNLLLWAQTQLKGLQAFPETVDLRSIAEEKISLFKENALHKNIAITNEIQGDALVFADKNHVSLVLRNLIANAIKFTEPGGRVALTSKEHQGNHEVSVTDSGIGLTLEEVKMLFNAETHFTKPGTNAERGVGIGLLLTREFIEANNGSIWVTSEVGKGTTFTFSLKARGKEALV